MKFFRNCKTFALMGTLALLLTGCGPSTEESFAAVSKAMQAALEKDFAHLKFSERSYLEGMRPTLIFDGGNSKILTATKPALWDRTFVANEVKMFGLAITRNGRYFSFSYTSQLKNYEEPSVFAPPCVESICRKLEFMDQLTRLEAMKWFFHSDAFTPERFQELFNEVAPAKQEEA